MNKLGSQKIFNQKNPRRILKSKNAYAIMPVGEMKKCVHKQRSKRPRRCKLRGLFYPSWRGGSVLRLTTSCYFPSSHLQMQQAITLAIMESINEESISINNAPPFCSCLGVVALPLYHIGKVQCKPASLSSSTCLIYIHGLRLPFGLCCPKPAHPPCTPCIRFLSVKLRFRYPFFSPIPHDINLGSRFGVRRQLRPLWTFTTD